MFLLCCFLVVVVVWFICYCFIFIIIFNIYEIKKLRVLLLLCELMLLVFCLFGWLGGCFCFVLMLFLVVVFCCCF